MKNTFLHPRDISGTMLVPLWILIFWSAPCVVCDWTCIIGIYSTCLISQKMKPYSQHHGNRLRFQREFILGGLVPLRELWLWAGGNNSPTSVLCLVPFLHRRCRVWGPCSGHSTWRQEHGLQWILFKEQGHQNKVLRILMLLPRQQRWWRICHKCRDTGSIPGRKAPWRGRLQPIPAYSCLKNPMDRKDW